MTVPVREGTSSSADAARRGWELAHWAVANSSALHIDRVSYAGREWTAGSTEGEWRTTGAQGSPAAGKAAAEVRIVTAQ